MKHAFSFDAQGSAEAGVRSNVPSLVCAFSASVTTGGTIYAFGIYGDALKKSLQLTQLQLNAISATFFIAGLFTWIPGLVVDRKGARFSLMLGGISGATSAMTYWAVARQFIVIPQTVAVLSVLAVCICLSCGLIIGSIFKLTLLCGGKGTRGSAVGVAKGFVGLGSGVYASIFEAFRTPDESALDFLPVVAFFFILCATLPASLLLPTKQQADHSIIMSESTPLHFRTMYCSLFALGIVIVGTSLMELMDEGDESDSRHGRDYGKVLLILVIWLVPIASLLVLPRQKAEDSNKDESNLSVSNGKNEGDSLLLTKTEDPENGANGRTKQEERQKFKQSYQRSYIPQASFLEEREDLTLPQMLQTASAWLMLWTTMILVGSGTYKTNNMGQMVDSLGFDQAVTPATLALFSVAQASARVITGVISEVTLKWRNVHSCCVDYGIPRPFYLVVASSIAVLTHLMLAFSTSQASFVSACTLSGIAFGMAWPLMVLIVGEVFGVTHHGANYMFYDGFTKAVGTLFLSEYVAGNVYENNVDPDDPLSCYGIACFQRTHLTVAALALTGAAASLALQFTSRQTYIILAYTHHLDG